MKSVIEDNREKEKILERILSSEGFVKSEKHCELLKYLYNAYIEGKVLKETIIALEFLGFSSVPGKEWNPLPHHAPGGR